MGAGFQLSDSGICMGIEQVSSQVPVLEYSPSYTTEKHGQWPSSIRRTGTTNQFDMGYETSSADISSLCAALGTTAV